MIDIHSIFFIYCLFSAAIFGFWIAAVIMIGKIEELRRSNDFYQEMLSIKDRETKDLEDWYKCWNK